MPVWPQRESTRDFGWRLAGDDPLCLARYSPPATLCKSTDALAMDSQPAGPASHPLRPYSTAPSLADWPSPPSASVPAAGSHAPPASAATRTVPPSLRLNPNNRYESSVEGLDSHVASAFPNAGAVLRAFVTTSLLSFTGVAMVQPFEVGKTLAQVQWVPRDGVEPFIGLDVAADENGDEQAVSPDNLSDSSLAKSG